MALHQRMATPASLTLIRLSATRCLCTWVPFAASIPCTMRWPRKSLFSVSSLTLLSKSSSEMLEKRLLRLIPKFLKKKSERGCHAENILSLHGFESLSTLRGKEEICQNFDLCPSKLKHVYLQDFIIPFTWVVTEMDSYIRLWLQMHKIPLHIVTMTYIPASEVKWQFLRKFRQILTQRILFPKKNKPLFITWNSSNRACLFWVILQI